LVAVWFFIQLRYSTASRSRGSKVLINSEPAEAAILVEYPAVSPVDEGGDEAVAAGTTVR
jgi:hypothetical protein